MKKVSLFLYITMAFIAPFFASALFTPLPSFAPTDPTWNTTLSLSDKEIANNSTYELPLNQPIEALVGWPQGDFHDVYAELYKGTLNNAVLKKSILIDDIGTSAEEVVQVQFDAPGDYFIILHELPVSCGGSPGGDFCLLPEISQYHVWFTRGSGILETGNGGIIVSQPPSQWGIVSFTVDQAQRNSVPELSLSTESGYASDEEGEGIEPNKGTADKTEMTFKSVYTDADNDAPTLFRTTIGDGTSTTTLSMHASSTDPLLSDGDYTNGEQFIATSTFPKGKYQYYFETSDGTATTTIRKADPLTFTTGYSNVAFLPGIQSSRLYTGENRLWEPNINNDVQKLMLDSTGRSLAKDIYTEDVIGKIFGFKDDIYNTFLDELASWEETGLVNKTEVLPYDWRLAFTNVLDGGKQIGDKIYFDQTYATDTPYILQELRKLAESSDNGKVTIVAHSMGGLLAKKLLADIEADPNHPYHDLLRKIDTLILVATPQLGTPKAIASMLHGYDQGKSFLGYNFITKETARNLSRNMLSAYTLLPSKMYTERVFQDGDTPAKIVSFNSNLSNVTDDPLFDPQTYLNTYGNSITNYAPLTLFLRGDEGRERPTKGDTTHPETLRSALLSDAYTLHREIDNWGAPDFDNDGKPDIRVVQIAGWGIKDTVRGVEYFANDHDEEICEKPSPFSTTSFCYEETQYDLGMTPKFTTDGDGTVVMPSAIAMRDQSDVETYFMDLYSYNSGPAKDRDHSSILEVPNIRIVIQNIVQNNPVHTSTFAYIKTKEEDLPKNDPDPYVRLSLYSPVAMDIYDSDGRHVGISASSTSERTIYDEQIPNSYYLPFGEGKYLGVPFTQSDAYTIDLSGTGTGTFTLELKKEKGDQTIATQTFVKVPVSTSTKATLSLATMNDAKELELDDDNDGTPDRVAFTEEHKKEITFGTLISELSSLDTRHKKELLKRAAIAQKQFQKEHYKAIKYILLSLKRKLSPEYEQHKHKRGHEREDENISPQDAIHAVAIIDTLLDKLNEYLSEKDQNKENEREASYEEYHSEKGYKKEERGEEGKDKDGKKRRGDKEGKDDKGGKYDHGNNSQDKKHEWGKRDKHHDD